MRRDAVRNQQLVLRAAREVFAEYGPDAQVESIAAQAGVGVGTIYRHFPNKDSLLDALVGSIVDELSASAEAALSANAGDGLECFLRILGNSFVEHRGYSAMLMERTRDGAAGRLLTLIGQLTKRAKKDGTLAPWVAVDDVMSLIWGVRGIVQASAAAAGVWERHLDICLAALKTPGLLPPKRSSARHSAAVS